MHLLIALLFAIATAHSRSFRAPNLAWTLTGGTPLTELSVAIPQFTVKADDPALDDIETVSVEFTTDPTEDYEAFDPIATCTAEAPDEPANADKEYTCEGTDFTEDLPLIGATNLYAWVTYGSAGPGSNEVAHDKITAPITVGAAAAWTASAEGGVKLSDPTKLPALTFTTTGPNYEGWTDEGMLARFTVGTKTAELEITGSSNVYTTADDGDIEDLDLDLTALPETIKVEIVLLQEDEPDPEVVHPQHFDLAIARVSCDYTVSPVKLFPEDLELEEATLIVTPAAEATWVKEKTYKALLNFEGVEVPETAECEIAMEANTAGTEWTITTNLSEITIGSNTQIFLWVAESTQETAFPVPFAIAYSPESFTVSDIIVTEEKKIATLTITAPDLARGWHESDISAKLVWDDKPILVNLTAGGSSNAEIVYTATDINVSDWDEIEDGDNVVIHAAKAKAAEPVYLTKTVTKQATVEEPSGDVTEWTIPETTVEFADPLKIPKLAITITQGGENWVDLKTAGDLVFRLSVVDPGRNTEPVDEIIKEITKEGDDFFIPETDISTFLLEAPETGESHTILVQIGEEGEDGEWLDCDATVVIVPAAPAAEFTVKPTKVDLRTDTKVNVEVARKATATTWEDEVHLLFSLTEVATQPEDDKFVATTQGTDKWTGELDLSKLTGAKKGDSIYVYVKHQAPETPGSNAKTGTFLTIPAVIAVDKSEPEPEAAMGVSPLLSLLAAALLLLVKLF